MGEHIAITVNGKSLRVPAGTILAAALAQAGVKRFRRSPSGGARGPLCGMGLCFECRVTLNGEPNCRSCLTLCENGMEAQTDDGSKPPSGEAAELAFEAACTSGSTESHTCDVLVVGAGPAGIAAACVASESGKDVIVLDNSPSLGGQIWRGEQEGPRNQAAPHWLSRLQKSGARIFSNATVFGTSGSRSLLAEIADGRAGNAANSTPHRVLEVSWARLIIATGAREVFLPFPGWTLPGVIGPGGLHAMAKAGWPVAGKRVVVAGSGPLLLAVAEGLQRHGSQAILVAEQAPWSRVMAFGCGLFRFPGKLAQAVRTRAALAGVPYQCGVWPVKADGTDNVSIVTLTDGNRTWRELCDYLACGFDLVPNLELPMLLGCAIANGRVEVDEFQETSMKNVFCAGEPTGIGGADSALIEGQIAGLAAAGKPEQACSLFRQRASWQAFKNALSRAFALRPELKRLAAANTIVCRCEDIPYEELSGFDNWRAAKLQTRCGMGACQGRICGTASNVLFGWTFSSVRPPIFPAATSALLAIGSKTKNKEKYVNQP